MLATRPEEGRRYNSEVGAPFYRDLMRVLNAVNSKREREGSATVTFRKAVDVMGYAHDSATGKIKSGISVPTNDRIENLASYLGISPTSFDLYVQRFAQDELERGHLLEMFRKMQNLEPSARVILARALERYADELTAAL